MPTLLVPPPNWIDPHNWTPNAAILPWLNVVNFGADPTGQLQSDAALNNAFTALTNNPSNENASGVIYVPAGVYNLTSGWTLALGDAQLVTIWCDPAAVVFNYTGTGDCIRMFGAFTAVHSRGSGILGYPTIDGNGSGANAAGLHFGDIFQGQVQVRTRNFTGANAIGVHFDNTIGFTEQLQADVAIKNNTNGVLFDVSGAALTSSASYARPKLTIWCESINPVAGHNGLVLQNGANLYDGQIGIYGNFPAAPSGSPASTVMTITGTVPAGHPGAGGFSKMFSNALNIGVETTTAAVPVQTINFGAAGNFMRDNYGILAFEDFGGSGPFFATSNVRSTGSLFRHIGPIIGDAQLDSVNYLGTLVAGAIVNGATITPASAGNVSVNPAGAVTGIIIAAGSRDGQLLTIVNLSASSVTFAASGTSNVAAGVSATVPALDSRVFVWNAGAGLWFGGV